jgi:hypothetical protein
MTRFDECEGGRKELLEVGLHDEAFIRTNGYGEMTA